MSLEELLDYVDAGRFDNTDIELMMAARLRAVAALHFAHKDGESCVACWREPWPCPTKRRLEGDFGQ